MNITPLELAIASVRGQTSLVKELEKMGVHVTQGSVSQWLKRGSGVPPKHALFVSALSGVHVSDLCPDIYPKSLFADLTIEQIKEYAHEKSRDCQTENG